MTQPDPLTELRAAIERAGTQTKFAECADLPQSYISAVLREERPPSDKLLEFLGLRRVIVPIEGE